jgi:hypothetical protein
MTPTLQRFASAVQRQLESYGWTVNPTWGEGYFAHLVHVECVHDDQRHGWGLLLPEIAWREAYKLLVQPRTGVDWFDLWTQCEQGEPTVDGGSDADESGMATPLYAMPEYQRLFPQSTDFVGVLVRFSRVAVRSFARRA